jgi:DNA-binding transcriptional regulator YdaS (Cro superfamily)
MKLNYLEIREDMKMDLNEYLKEHGAAKRLSQKSGISPPEISRLRTGKKKITFASAAAIEFGSDGAIKMESLLEDQHHRTIAGFIRANVSK